MYIALCYHVPTIRGRSTADMADASHTIKTKLIKAEDARILWDMEVR